MKPYDRDRLSFQRGNYRDLEKFSLDLKSRFGDAIPENAKYNCILADFGFSRSAKSITCFHDLI